MRYGFALRCLYWFPHPLALQQSGPEFAADMRFEVLLVWLLHPMVNGQSDPLTVIGAILDTVGIEYVPPPARPGTCRDCSRSNLARFGIGHLSFFQDGMFGVYVEVAKLRNWIDEKISEPSALPDDMPL